VVGADGLYGGNTEFSFIRRIPLAGGAAELVAKQQTYVGSLFWHPTGLYWASLGAERPADVGWIARISAGQSEPSTLASKLTWPSSLASDGVHLYFTDYKRMIRIPIGGGMPEILAEPINGPTGLVIDGDTLYWIDWGTISTLYKDGQIMTMPKSGGTPRELARNQWAPSSLAVDEEFVYWTASGTIAENHRDGGVYKKAKSGAGITSTLAAEQWDAEQLHLGGSYVYWLGAGSVRRCPKAGGKVETLVEPPDVRVVALAQDERFLYYATDRGRTTDEEAAVWRLAK
jgi:hypothetical protein